MRQNTRLCSFHVISLCGLLWVFSQHRACFPSEDPEVATWKRTDILRSSLRVHGTPLLPYSIGRDDKGLPRFKERKCRPHHSMGGMPKSHCKKSIQDRIYWRPPICHMSTWETVCHMSTWLLNVSSVVDNHWWT